MSYKSFTFQIIARVLLLSANIIAISFMAYNSRLWITLIVLCLLAIIQITELIWFINQIQQELNRFLTSIKYDDFSVKISNPKLGKRFKNLSESFQDIIDKLKNARIEKEGQLELFKTLMMRLNIGMIAFHPVKGDIVLMNTAASSLLNIPLQTKWSQIQNRAPWLAKVVESISFGGRKLASIDESLTKKEFSVDVGFVRINNQNYSLVSFQDIKDEIEQKEIEAWHKLIRILTHEIMNSITPVSSLSETMIGMLSDNQSPLKAEELDNDTVEDLLLAVNTIHKRSNGMLEFVDDYRKLTRIPAPNFEMIRISELFGDILQLMKADLDKRHISTSIDTSGQHIYLKCDRKLVEQILINLFSNAFYALNKTEKPRIKLSVEASDKNIAIHFSDNGSGISPEKLERIFIPFYSTKEHGSGIGLALSKNIMQVHQGNLTVSSAPNQETRFTLTFLNHTYEGLTI